MYDNLSLFCSCWRHYKGSHSAKFMVNLPCCTMSTYTISAQPASPSSSCWLIQVFLWDYLTTCQTLFECTIAANFYCKHSLIRLPGAALASFLDFPAVSNKVIHHWCWIIWMRWIPHQKYLQRLLWHEILTVFSWLDRIYPSVLKWQWLVIPMPLSSC